jgi:predicted DsbA family dithiol-disulfide isomerase
MSLYLKALTAITFALCLAVFAPALNPCLADFVETGVAPSNPATAVGKVLVVLVYDQHCKVWCTHVRPIVRELGEEFGERVHVEEIDNSPSNAEAALKQVKDLGILALYKDVESVPVVLIFDVKRKQCKEINGPKDKAIYKAAIEKVIAKGQ